MYDLTPASLHEKITRTFLVRPMWAYWRQRVRANSLFLRDKSQSWSKQLARLPLPEVRHKDQTIAKTHTPRLQLRQDQYPLAEARSVFRQARCWPPHRLPERSQIHLASKDRQHPDILPIVLSCDPFRRDLSPSSYPYSQNLIKTHRVLCYQPPNAYKAPTVSMFS